MNTPNYWSLDCDIIAGPQEGGVKIGAAETPSLAKDIVAALNSQSDTKLPSRFQVGDRVKVLGTYEASVEAVRFTEAKVRYDVFLDQLDTRLDNVDSFYVTEIEVPEE